MSDIKNKAEQVKGHAKEALGDVTDDDKLRNEGKADRASGKIKETVEGAKDKVEEAVDKVKDKVERH